MGQEEIKRAMQCALGKGRAELVLKNASVLNVFLGEWNVCDVAIAGGKIVGIGHYSGVKERDFTGKFLAPGYIDAHVHVESSMLLPQVFAYETAKRGTTTLIADPHEIANVCGADGLSYMLGQAENAPVNLCYMLPSCVPSGNFDTGGASLDADALRKFIDHPAVLGLGEVMNVPGVLGCDADLHQKLFLCGGKNIDGHAPSLHGKPLQAYRLAGITTDHESVSGEEALEKLRAGLAVLIREGSGARNLDSLMRFFLQNDVKSTRIAFCTDDKHIDDIRSEGHIDHHIRRSIMLGLDPVEAYRMASFYPAQLYGLQHLGAIAAGYQADIVVLRDPHEPAPEMVFHKGRPIGRPNDSTIPSALYHTVHLPDISREKLCLRIHKERVPVIVPFCGQILTGCEETAVPVKDGVFVPGEIYQKAAVLERHGKNGNVGLGIVKGFLRNGAIAATVGHDAHNLIVIGTNDEDMLLAIKTLRESGGGYTAVRDQMVLAQIELPIAGLMNSCSADELSVKLKDFTNAAHKIGVPKGMDPCQTLSFLPLPVLPKLRITDKGLLDVETGTFLTY